MSDYTELSGFDDEQFQSTEVKIYKNEVDNTDRIGFVPKETLAKDYLEKLKKFGKSDEEAKQIIAAKGKKGSLEKVERDGQIYFRESTWLTATTHYHAESKKRFVCLGPGEICCKKIKDSPITQFITLICKYMTKPNGDLIEPIQAEVKPWRMGESKYVDLKDKDKRSPLIKYDIEFKCTDTKFQKGSMNVIFNEGVALKRDPKVEKEVMDRAAALWPIIGKKFLGERLTEDEVREMLSGETINNEAPKQEQTEVKGEDLGSVLDNF